MLMRSCLFVPGNNYRAILKANTLNFDVCIYDLEDAVSMEEKETARIFIKSIANEKFEDGRLKFVRVNSINSGIIDDDLQYVLFDGIDGVMLPKTESAKDLELLIEKMKKIEEERGLEEKKIIALIETPMGVMNSIEIAKNDRVIALAFGALDYYRSLGRIKFSETQIELLFARCMIVNSAKAYGKKAIDTPFLGLIIDKEGLRREAMMAKQLGFDGKMAIHPNHIPIINEIFSPSEDEVKEAEELVKAYEEAKTGVISFKGKMVDYASYVQAKETVEIYKMIRSRSK